MTGCCDCSGKHILDAEKAWTRQRGPMCRDVGPEAEINGHRSGSCRLIETYHPGQRRWI